MPSEADLLRVVLWRLAVSNDDKYKIGSISKPPVPLSVPPKGRQSVVCCEEGTRPLNSKDGSEAEWRSSWCNVDTEGEGEKELKSGDAKPNEPWSAQDAPSGG